MTTTTSVTGRPAVHITYREVWPDQIDNRGEPCEYCQLEDRTVECNIYVPVPERRGEARAFLSACYCCAPGVVLDHPELDPSRDAIIEYAKEN